MASRLDAVRSTLRWLPAYLAQRLTNPDRGGRAKHLVIGVADHFEPSIVPGADRRFAARDEQIRRLERWCERYPRVADTVRDAEGVPLRHTYFYPAEQHDAEIVGMLADHCHGGWGEVEIQLHHGVDAPDTADNTRQTLLGFRDALVSAGCLARWDGAGAPRYAFVHGNWALANSNRGRNCGVDGEMQILSDTGCYADFTLPSAPEPTQVPKINSVYECAGRLDRAVPHRRGRDLRVGVPPARYPLIVQGPLRLVFDRSGARVALPRIENGELSARRAMSVDRVRQWVAAGVSVRGRPDWVFIKLHCHGMDPRDEDAMFGDGRRRLLRSFVDYADSTGSTLHFVTAREMTNVLLAACDGRGGSPGEWREYRLRLAPPPSGHA
jgi:hypothetical protein